MREQNGNRMYLLDVIEIDEDTYLLKNGCINTDEEYYEDMYNIKSVDLNDLVVESGDDIAMYIYDIDYKERSTTLELFNVTNDTVGYVILNGTVLSDDRRYYALHHITHIFRQQGLSDVCCYWYLWRTKEEIEDYYDMIQSYIDLED